MMTKIASNAGPAMVSKEPASKDLDPQLDRKLKEVSALYEKQFLREMVKAMRKTVEEAALTEPSMGEKIYRDQLDEQYVETWGDHGGIGLADLIYHQLRERM